MEDVKNFFRETQEAFTIYVVEQRFVVGRGYDYFKSFIGKENLIIDDSAMKKRIKKVIMWAQNHVPNVAELVKFCFTSNGLFSPTNIIDIITALSKLFSLEKHQAVGPDIIDPLIIQEGKISKKYLSQLVSLHQESILQPTIIILLIDNDFERAKELVSKCPNGINVKFIRNSGESVIYKIINNGAEDVNEFIDSFSKQCFSTCSSTKRDILFSNQCDNNIIQTYAPHILRFRSLLIEEDNSIDTLNDINSVCLAVEKIHATSEKEQKTKECLICMLKLFKVYCMDRCTSDMYDALNISKSLNNEILHAHVLRYSNFFTDISLTDKNTMLMDAAKIFEKNRIEDHAIYCTNNHLINQFYSEKIDIEAFRVMKDTAIYNVPGLVGMSYVFNNTGVAYLYTHNYDEAIDLFGKGIAYAKYRPVQKLGLMTNLLIAKKCNYCSIDNEEIEKLISTAFDLFGCEKSSFLTANFVINSLVIAASIDYSYAVELTRKFEIVKLFQNALSCGQFGTGSLSFQIALLQNLYPRLLPVTFLFPQNRTSISGYRMRFLQNHMLNPTIFNAWL